MKIAFLSRYQNKFQRGAENFVFELSKRLSKRHKVSIFSDKDADNISNLIRGKYDAAIPINGRLQALLVSLGRLMGGYKLIITGHSGIGKDDIWNILVKPDIFVALTDYQKDWAKKWAWGSKVVKIPNGIDLEKFSPRGDKLNFDLERPIILSVGALVWYKYHERVIDAVSKLDKGSLLIVGEGIKKDELEQKGQKLLGSRFKIANFQYKDMPKVYRSCDLFTLPSWSREAFGIVYLEAIASGLGVVAHDDRSRREIIGDAGLFVNVNDPKIYAKAIDEALNFDWSKKARRQAEKFSWDKVADAYNKVISELVS